MTGPGLGGAIWYEFINVASDFLHRYGISVEIRTFEPLKLGG